MQTSLKIVLIVLLFLFYSSNNKASAQLDSNKIELNIFPNPNHGTFYITLQSEVSYYAKLYAMDGRLASTLYLQNGLNYISINIPPGIYLLTAGEDMEQFKIQIK
jgi:hypothetical protein